MNPIMLTIGTFEIRWYSFCILIGALLGIKLFTNEGKKFKYDLDYLFNLAFWVIIFGLIGARIYYVLFNFSVYNNDILSAFKIWEGGLAIHGGILFGLITTIVYTKKYNINTLKIMDMIVPSLIFAQGIGRWGNFFNSEAYGSVISKSYLIDKNIPEFIIDGMLINNNYHHPTFYYEFLVCLFGFLVLLIVRRFNGIKIGWLTSIYLIWYGIGRFFIESLRTDSLMFGAFKVAQLVSLSMILIGIIILLFTCKKGKYESLYNAEEDMVKF